MAKKITLISLLILMLILPAAVFDDTGIGGVAGWGQPTGLSLKFNNFPVISLGWSLSEEWVEGTVDYWIINKTLDRSILFYAGGGVKVSLGSTFGLSLRVPVGLQWYFLPGLELFGELVPGMAVLPETDFELSAGLGLRYHF